MFREYRDTAVGNLYMPFYWRLSSPLSEIHKHSCLLTHKLQTIHFLVFMLTHNKQAFMGEVNNGKKEGEMNSSDQKERGKSYKKKDAG